MSHVYRALDTIIGRTVAVKILTDQGAQDPAVRERFLDEARTAAKVTHENVVNIFDFGMDPEKGLFMVMEFLQGQSLRERLVRETQLPVNEAVRIARVPPCMGIGLSSQKRSCRTHL